MGWGSAERGLRRRLDTEYQPRRRHRLSLGQQHLLLPTPHGKRRLRTSQLTALPKRHFIFLSSFYSHVVCANASAAAVCCRRRGSVLDAQHSAARSPQQPVLTVPLIKMLELLELINRPILCSAWHSEALIPVASFLLYD